MDDQTLQMARITRAVQVVFEDPYGSLHPRQTIGPYLSYAYRLDPFHGLFKAGVGTTVVSLDDCAPDDFRNTEYYRVFYSDTGLRDEVTLFVAAPRWHQYRAGTGPTRLSPPPQARCLHSLCKPCCR